MNVRDLQQIMQNVRTPGHPDYHRTARPQGSPTLERALYIWSERLLFLYMVERAQLTRSGVASIVFTRIRPWVNGHVMDIEFQYGDFKEQLQMYVTQSGNAARLVVQRNDPGLGLRQVMSEEAIVENSGGAWRVYHR